MKKLKSIFSHFSSRLKSADEGFPFAVAQLINRDEQAWDAFVDWSAGLFHHIIMRIQASESVSLNNDERDDVLQEIYARLYKDDCHLLRQFDPGRASFKTWLALVARSTALNYVRSNMPEILSIHDVPEEELPKQPPIRKEFVLPEGVLSAKEARIIRMRYEEGHSFDEIADLMQISRQTVYNSKSNAVKKLRVHYGDA
ncbi:MAG: RNA polymerase sigma factor [Candidatus Sumerlaeia bacterium]